MTYSFITKILFGAEKKAAEFLRKGLMSRNGFRKSKIRSKQLGEAELDVILDFFEGLGMLVYKKTIDKELTYNYFSWWLECYYILAKDYISHWREEDPNYWANVEWLYQNFATTKNKDISLGKDGLSQDEIEVFIKHEINLK